MLTYNTLPENILFRIYMYVQPERAAQAHCDVLIFFAPYTVNTLTYLQGIPIDQKNLSNKKILNEVSYCRK